MVDKEKQERFAMTNAFPWDNPGKDSLEELQALLKETGREVTLQELQEMQRKVIYETDPRLDPNFESSEGETL
jgi:hypothetical protein